MGIPVPDFLDLEAEAGEMSVSKDTRGIDDVLDGALGILIGGEEMVVARGQGCGPVKSHPLY